MNTSSNDEIISGFFGPMKSWLTNQNTEFGKTRASLLCGRKFIKASISKEGSCGCYEIRGEQIDNITAMAFLTQIFPISSPHLLQGPVTEEKQTTVLNVIEQMMTEEWEKIVIVGPERADKTALVFQAAVSMAASGARVTYICTHPLKSLPTQIHGMMTPQPGIMRNVDFLYLEETSELVSWCAGVHTKVKLPSLIIIEDILAYASQINEKMLERSLARLCATIADAAAWIASKNDVKRCQVLMTAPTRITSLCSVLSQFNFKIATYQGPSQEDPDSEVVYATKEASIKVKFYHKKDSLFVTTVQASQTDNT